MILPCKKLNAAKASKISFCIILTISTLNLNVNQYKVSFMGNLLQ